MFRSLRCRRRPRYGAHACAFISALLLLLSVSLLHTRLFLSHNQHYHHLVHSRHDPDSSTVIRQNALLSDSEDNSIDDAVDRIDELDTFEEQKDNTDEDNLENAQSLIKKSIPSSGYYVDHITGSIRRALHKRSIDEWVYDRNSFSLGTGVEDQSKAAFGSDNIPIDEDVRRKVNEVNEIEDALLLKIGKSVSPLREGWGDWFDKKGDFLRRDRMFKSNLDALNPLNNPLLLDPDGVGVTGLTRGDKAVQKLLLNEFKKTPFLVKKPPRVLRTMDVEQNGKERDGGIKAAERRIFNENVSSGLYGNMVNKIDVNLISGGNNNVIVGDNSRKNGSSTERIEESNGYVNLSSESITGVELSQVSVDNKAEQKKPEELSHVFPDGKRWAYFPGQHPYLSFSDFMDSFFRKGKCEMRVFMVWNYPPWMYTVRHQRVLESLQLHHRDACVVVFSETIELDFFAGSFVKDGYKVAVAMPNLDELLKDTPTAVFADVWSEWRETKFYPTHYSELVRLAALYKYGGLYLDFDIIVLNPLSSLNNTVGLEVQHPGSTLNGAVMAFQKNSPFIMECLNEFYTTYDDTHLRWNGADLITRVARKFLNKEDKSMKKPELNVHPSYIFFPIDSQDILSYFTSPATESEKGAQDVLFNKILRESLTFHFWSGLTSALLPEPGSLVARLLDHACIRCFDIL